MGNPLTRIRDLYNLQNSLKKFQDALSDYQKEKLVNSLSFKELLLSKTFWSGVLMFAFNSWNNAHGSVFGIQLAPAQVTLVNGVLGFLVAIFRMFPTQGAKL